MENLNKLPTCKDYSELLEKAAVKFKITINEARKKYGLFTYKQWQEILK